MKQQAKTTIIVLMLTAGMFGLSFAAVPLYDLFCRVTGFGGTPQINENATLELQAGTKAYAVLFNADVAKGVPLRFRPEIRRLTSLSGTSQLMHYQATHLGEETFTGIATFNVLPEKAAKYFVKVACFCFEEQTFAPGQKVNMPVSFYVDPAIESDPQMHDVKAITLSYTFFEKTDE